MNKKNKNVKKIQEAAIKQKFKKNVSLKKIHAKHAILI
jgi:hypothetical protein